MKIAIIGSGISGLYAAWRLSKQHDVTIFEKNNYFGGHTDTHQLEFKGHRLAIDSGFIIFNEQNYPLFCSMLRALNVPVHASNMSYAVNNRQSGLTYNPSSKWSLLASPLHFLRRDFRQMTKDLHRFYAAARHMQSDQISIDVTLDDYLNQHHYSTAFRDEHLYPICGALWSTTLCDVGQLPLRFVMGFLQHHRLLQLDDHPVWLTVKGGSNQYIYALEQQCNIRWHQQEITQVKRFDSHVEVGNEHITEHFDWVVFATPADSTLRLLQQPSDTEQQVLGAFSYQDNTTVVHSDTRVMPAQKRLWASWQVRVMASALGQAHYSCSYWMNKLQHLDIHIPILATINPNIIIDRQKVLLERVYRHPHFNRAALHAQQQWPTINGKQRSSFCGAYWGWGFHEDGARSAEQVVNALLAQSASQRTSRMANQ